MSLVNERSYLGYLSMPISTVYGLGTGLLNTLGYVLASLGFAPTTDNTITLGTATNRWSELHAVQINNTSGENTSIGNSVGQINTSGSVIPSSNNTYNLGSTASKFGSLWVSNINNTSGKNTNIGYSDATITLNGTTAFSGRTSYARPFGSYYLSLASVPNVTDTTATWTTISTQNTSYSSLLTYSSGVFTNASSETLTLALNYWVYSNAASSGTMQAWVTTSATGTNRYGATYATNSSGNPQSINGSCIISVASGTTFFIHLYQNSGSALTLNNAANASGLNIAVL